MAIRAIWKVQYVTHQPLEAVWKTKLTKAGFGEKSSH